MDTHTTAARMTRAEIHAQIAHYQEVEKKLLAQIISAEKTGGPEQFSASPQRSERILNRARARLNGHSAEILRPGKANSGLNLAALREEREAVELILSSLNEAHIEAFAAEALARAEKIAPAWAALRARRAAAKAELEKVDQRIAAFRDAEREDVLQALAGLVGRGEV